MLYPLVVTSDQEKLSDSTQEKAQKELLKPLEWRPPRQPPAHLMSTWHEPTVSPQTIIFPNNFFLPYYADTPKYSKDYRYRM